MPAKKGPVTEEQCQHVIANKLQTTNFKIKSFENVPFKELNGFLGEHSTLKVRFECNNNQAATETFFVKTVPNNEAQRAFLDEINGFHKEAQFFNKYCAHLKHHKITVFDDAMPLCYFANHETLILENLANYRTLCARKSLSLECVRLGLASLAKLHASGFILQDRQAGKLVDEFAEELREGFFNGSETTVKAFNSCKHGIRALIDLTHTDSMRISKACFTQLALQGLDEQKIVTAPSHRFKNTICHADPWTKNMMFRFDGEGKPLHCVFLDFQTYRYGPPAQDVMAFLYLVAEKGLREEHMHELLAFYHATLDGLLRSYGLENFLPKSEFDDNCEHFELFAILQHVTHFQVVLLDGDIIRELFLDQEKAQYVTLENKYDFVVEACGKDAVYRKKLYGAIAELREYFEKRI